MAKGAGGDMTGKTVIITGANSGIGKVAARELARLGAHVVMACRSVERGAAARQDLLDGVSRERLEVMALDLADLESVRAFAADFLARHDRLEVLLLNAGVYKPARRETKQGFELTFGVNHLGHFLLTHLLLDRLTETARAEGEARVVTVSSKMHERGRIDFDDLQKRRRYDGVRAYRDSKVANILFAAELTRRLTGTGVTSNSLHPGAAWTGIYRDLPKILQGGIRLFTDSMETIARTSIHLASSPDVAGVTGRYYAREKEATPARHARNPETARRLWEVSAELVAL